MQKELLGILVADFASKIASEQIRIKIELKTDMNKIFSLKGNHCNKTSEGFSKQLAQRYKIYLPKPKANPTLIEFYAISYQI